MLRLLIASVALALAWSWLRAEFSRAIDAKAAPRKDAIVIRGAAFALALVWFLFSVGGAFGTLLVWGALVGLVAAGVWFVKGGFQRPAEDSPPPDAAPPTDEKP